MGGSGFATRRGTREGLNLPIKKLAPPLYVSSHSPLDSIPNIGKNNSFLANFTKNFASGAHFQFHNHDLFEKFHWN